MQFWNVKVSDTYINHYGLNSWDVMFVVHPVWAAELFWNGHPLTVLCAHKSPTVRRACCIAQIWGECKGSLLIDLLHAAMYIDLFFFFFFLSKWPFWNVLRKKVVCWHLIKVARILSRQNYSSAVHIAFCFILISKPMFCFRFTISGYRW
jgi:hypothetical protein